MIKEKTYYKRFGNIMEIWIRSQDKTQIAQITGLLLNDNEIRGFTNYHQNYYELGKYKTEERALEVLDEISSKIKNRYIVSTTAAIISKNDMAKEYKRLNYLYSGEFIMNEPPFEIKPINNNIIYYEMPEE